MRKYLLLAILVTSSLLAWSQDFSNKGKDFWIPYPEHANGTNSVMGIYITSDVNTTAEITVGSVVLSNIPVVANSVTRKFIGPNGGGDAPNTNVYLGNIQDSVVSGKSIHITSLKPVAVFAHIIYGARSGATLVLPTAVWGREYVVPSFGNVGNGGGPNQGIGQVCVIASKPNTEIEVTTLVNSRNGVKTPGTYTVTIPNPGDIYQLQFLSNTDISGTTIRSKSNATTGCNPIAVFSATTWSAFPCTTPVASGGDNLFQQLFPSGAWGKKYLTMPLKKEVWNNADNNLDYIRVFVKDPLTQVFKTENGVKTALTGLISPGNYYQFTSSRPTLLESDQPVQVVQYVTSQNCGNPVTLSDPEMIVLSPVEQTVSNVSVFMAHQNFVPAGQSQVTRHYINVTMKTIHTAQFRINGNLPNTVFMAIPGTEYSYIKEELTAAASSNPVFTLTADSGFNATAYGFGNVESYGYNAGTNVKDLYQTMTIQNEYGTVNFPAACKSSPFRFNITLPYITNTLTWQFGGLFPDTTYTTAAPDSSWIVNGKPIYQYRLNRPYITSSLGTFPIAVFAYNPTSDGCAGLQEIDWDLQIFENPVANFTYSHTGCVSDSIAFFDGSNPFGRPIIKNYWDYGDTKIDSVLNPKHKYLTAGNKTVRHSVITDVGCLSDTASKVIPITDPPVAGFTSQAPYCEKSAITFKDASTIAVGAINKWIWNFGDGGTLTALNGNDVQHTYTAAGTYNVTLQVETASGCLSTVFSKPVVIKPLPVTNFNLPGNICLPWDNAAFTDISTISDGTQASFVYAWDFGDGSAVDANKNPVHHYTAVGPYNVKLTVTTVNGCIKDTVKVLNTVYAQPRSGYTVSGEVCLNDTTRFTQSASGSGSTITNWNWTFGDGTTATDQNPDHKYLTDGAFQTSLYIVTDKGCHSDTLTVPTIVNPLPVAAFTSSAPACETGEISFTDKSTVKQGSVIKWNWTLGDGTTSASQNPKNTYTAAGTYDITLGVESAKGCKSPVLTQPLKINYLPQTAFGMPEVCLSDPFAEFTDSSRIGDNTEAQFTYQWNFGDPNATAGNPNTSIQKNPRHKYTATGIYTVSLTVTSAAGCVTSVTKPFTVNGSIPQAAFTVNNANALCSNQEMSITDASTVNFGSVVKVEVYWDYGNNPTIKTVDETPNPGKQYIHQYPDFGTPGTKTFTIRYVAYSGINCINEITKTVTVKASPKVQFDALANVCEEVPPFNITAARDIYNFPGTGTYSGPGIVNASGSFSPASAKPGTHTIRYDFNATNGCSAFAEQTITVDPTPTADAGPDRTVLEGGFIVINGKGTGNNVSYLWTPNTAIADNKVANPKVSPVDDITYTLTVTSASGCVSSDKVFVKVLKMPKVPNAFSPNGDGINDKWVIEYLETYPGATVEVFNRYGQKVYESVGYDKPWDGTLRGQPLPVATYYWIINPKNGRQQMNGSVTIIR